MGDCRSAADFLKQFTFKRLKRFFTGIYATARKLVVTVPRYVKQGNGTVTIAHYRACGLALEIALTVSGLESRVKGRFVKSKKRIHKL